MELKIKDFAESALATPPLVYFQLQKALDDPESSFDDFAKIIGTDPALTARLLKIVNSAFYGFDSEVETIAHALNILGIGQLAELALATTVISQFKGVPRDLVDMESFWVHSIACGLAARIIAKHRNESLGDAYYIAGMLHDIVKIIIYKEAPEEAKEIISQCQASGTDLLTLENKVLGVDHAQLGGELLGKWGLPERIVEAVSFHHHPMKAEKFPLHASIVHLANHMVYEMKLGTSGEPSIPSCDAGAMKKIGLTEATLETIQEDVKDQIQEAVDMFLKQ